MDKSDKLFAINQALPGLECFLREVLSNEGLSAEAEKKRQEFLKRLESVSTPPSLPPRPPQLPARPHLRNELPSGSGEDDQLSNSLYKNSKFDDPVAFASHQRELSRHYTFSKGYVGRKELFGEDSPLYITQPPSTIKTHGQRDSIKSSSSDELYERLSFGEAATSTPDGMSTLPEDPNTPQDGSTIGARGGLGRGSGGKGKLTSGWFKKEVKIYENIRLSDISNPVIQGYLRDVKSKQRRWCVLKDEKLYIFKTRDDPCSQIIDLPNCDIGVDDKKKISYSFSLRQSGAPLVQLAIEEGHDLSPWMSAIMAAAVHRSDTYRPISPLENAFALDKSAKSPYGYMKINIPSNDNEDEGSTYEVPLECFSEMFQKSGYQSTPTGENNSDLYNPPLPPLPIDSSSETSSDDDDEDDNDGASKQLQQGEGKRQSLADDGTDSHSDQSNHYLSFSNSLASDESKYEKGLRKRSSKALSNESLDSGGSGTEMTAKQQHLRKTSISSGPRTKRRRKQTSAESEAKFLKDPHAIHSGVLFQKRPLGVWSKRYCKLMGEQLRCYRHADDIKPSLTIDLRDHDISLIDSKESKKAYCFKVSHPTLESFCFATDSRVAVERWIELLSLAATGRHDIVAPYPPYFKADSSDELQPTKSQDSLNFYEDALESGDATDFASDRSVKMDDDASFFAADELEEDLSSDARDDSAQNPLNHHRVKSPQRRSPRHVKGGARGRAIRRKSDTKKNEIHREEAQYVSQRSVISDSGSEGKADTKISSTDIKKEKPKGWAESLKLKQTRFPRGHSFSAMITGTTPEAPKNRLNVLKKTNIQSYSHLLSLLDREGRFSGFLTEVKVSKYSRTQLRRWCIVKNGVLNLYNKQQTDEEPAVKLNLAEMWLSQNEEDFKNKYTFELNDKDGRVFTFQVAGKEDFDKWLEVLRVFTEIRVERPSPTPSAEQLDKNSVKGKEEGTPINTFAKRSSIRLKLSQKVSVIDIFKRSQTYDFDDNPNSGEVPVEDVKFINFTGGQLTEVYITDDHYTWSRVRWCTIKYSELLIFLDSECDEPIKRIPLYNVRLEEACEPEKNIYKFKIHSLNDSIVLMANNKVDYERWVKQVHDAILSLRKHDHELSKCRFPSPPRVFGHRRSRSESLNKFSGSVTTSDISSTASSPEKRLSQLSFGSDLISTSSDGSTDTLMNGHLQEIVPPATSGVRKWCVVSSEHLYVYDSDDQDTPIRKIILQDWKVKEQTQHQFGFSLQQGDDILLYQHCNKEVAAQWLSVLHRYCQPQEDKLSPLVRCSKPTKSLSDDNLKGHSLNQEKRFLRKTLSEGRASGRKLLRKISEDNLLHKYRRAELFKVPWKGSAEKVNSKSREQTPLRDLERRFSCGSLFDNEGKFSGYLVELVTRPLCRSEVRRWCVLCDENLYIYDQPRMEPYRKKLSIDNMEIINESVFEEGKFVLKLKHDKDCAVVFKMANRNEFEKWVAALSVKVNVLKSRQKRRGLVIDEEQLAETESSPRYAFLPPSIQSVSLSIAGDVSNDTDTSLSRSTSNVSNDSVFSRVRPGQTLTPQKTETKTSGSYVYDVSADTASSARQEKEQDESSDDTLKRNGSIINLGTFQVPSSVFDPVANDCVQTNTEVAPIYENIPHGDEPIYENVNALEGSNTLSSMTVEQIDLHSYEGRISYRKLQKGLLLDNCDESMFMDMLPKRSSEYDLGPLYENIEFMRENKHQDQVPLWSVRSSKDLDDVFVNSNQNTWKSRDENKFNDRQSLASDYSGIVGEALLEEVPSCSTSRSDTLSSQTSMADQAELAAFDKELLGDILGLPVTSEEAQEISEFCSRCDEQTDIDRNRRSGTLTNQQTSEVFFDACSDFSDLRLKDVADDVQRALDGPSEAHDTYFGPSSSEDESFIDCQGFTTAESSPYHRKYSADRIECSSQNNCLDVTNACPTEDTSREVLNNESESIEASTNEGEAIELLKNSEKSLNKVIPNEGDKAYFSAQSSLDNTGDIGSPVVLRNKVSSVPAAVRQELTKSQTEFIKAVTDAFEGINNLTLDDDGDNTRF